MAKTGKQINEPINQKPLRLWPGIVIVVLQWLFRFGLINIMPEGVMLGVFGGLIGGFAIIIWWAFFSRAPRFERWGAVILMMVALPAAWPLLHESMRLMPFVAYIIPILTLAFVAWAVAGRRLSERPRRAAMIATILLACGVWILLRTRGVYGEFYSDFTWRWTETSEEQLLAQKSDEPMMLPLDSTVADTGYYWPGFRGTNRDGIIRGVCIETDWSESPPARLWRRLIGPGWSSFAVHGSLFYTQEQRGEDEIVSCYHLTTGKPVWRHVDTTRFWESNSGPGPRATPTRIDGRVYSFGATGILNVLDARDGSVLWSRNAATDTDTKIPTWGFSSSPLVVNDAVIVAPAGSLIAYDLTTGQPRWFSMAGGDCYSSPHLARIAGITQILLLNEAGTSSVAPADGTLLWEHLWPGYPIVQPALTANGDILVSADERTGVRRITVTNGPGGWTVAEHWTSARIKPYFNDSVIHDGHVYGFDGRSLACLDFENGERKWKGGRYGRGQTILLADQDLLLVLSEKGDIALVKAIPDQFTELARIPAIEGKTWNHPVLVGDILLVRNAREMAAFRLSLAGS